MNGLKHIFLRIIPIITLICFISFGVIQIFNNQNLTYLSENQINIGTEENPKYTKQYTFDMISYTQNIDQNILKRSINHSFNLNAYENTLNKFKAIWQDGYQLFDVTKTIANGVVLVINSLISPINIILIPLRISAGILLTGMSIVGININNGQIISPTLNFLVDKAAIPYINPQTNGNYTFYRNINEHYNGNQTININFEHAIYNSQFTGIKITQYSGSHVKMEWYSVTDNQWITIFDSGRSGDAWNNYYDWDKDIIIENIENLTQEQTTFLQNYGIIH